MPHGSTVQNRATDAVAAFPFFCEYLPSLAVASVTSVTAVELSPPPWLPTPLFEGGSGGNGEQPPRAEESPIVAKLISPRKRI